MLRRLTAIILLILLSSLLAVAQQPTRESVEAKKKRLAYLHTSIEGARKKQAELAAEIARLNSLLQSATEKEGSDSFEAMKLEKEIAEEAETVAFLESPARTVLAVASATTFEMDFDGKIKLVALHGIVVDPAHSAALIKSWKKYFLKKSLYVRCVDSDCNYAYIYDNRNNKSVNAELVSRGFASAKPDARFDVSVASTNRSPSPSTAPSSSSSNSAAGTDVQVRGYYRKDGTYVKPHTRSAPGRKKKN